MKRPPDDFALWGLHCFCLGARRVPQTVVRMDDNGVVLHRAQEGMTREALGASESQIAFLEAFGLLEAIDGRYRSTFPAVQAGPLRERIALEAGALSLAIVPETRAIGRELRRIGRGGSLYAVLFGQVLDGLFWEELAARDTLPPTRLDLEHPFWRGAFWAVWPPRKGAAGVNVLQGRRARLTMVWSEVTAAELRHFARREDVIAGLARDLSAGAESVRLGGIDLPVLRRDPPDAVVAPARSAAQRLADWYLPRLAVLGDGVLPPGLDPRLAAVIVGHELIWSLAAQIGVPGGLAASMFVETGTT